MSHDAGAPDAWSPTCPGAAPTLGTECAPDGLVCEYSAVTDAGCDGFFACDAGIWEPADATGLGIACPPSPNADGCPATLSEILPGSSCTTTLACTYAQGYCVCESVLLPEITAPEHLWTCGPQSGCPPTAPRLGGGCSSPGTTCTYLPCFGATCVDEGYWQSSEITCGG